MNLKGNGTDAQHKVDTEGLPSYTFILYRKKGIISVKLH